MALGQGNTVCLVVIIIYTIKFLLTLSFFYTMPDLICRLTPLGECYTQFTGYHMKEIGSKRLCDPSDPAPKWQSWNSNSSLFGSKVHVLHERCCATFYSLSGAVFTDSLAGVG